MHSFFSDLNFHLAPAVLLLLDLLLLSPRWTIKPFPVFLLSSAIAVGYWYWIEHCFSHNQWYPYPLFEQLDNTGRAVLFAGSAATMGAVTLLLQKGYAILNGIEGMKNAARVKTS